MAGETILARTPLPPDTSPTIARPPYRLPGGSAAKGLQKRVGIKYFDTIAAGIHHIEPPLAPPQPHRRIKTQRQTSVIIKLPQITTLTEERDRAAIAVGDKQQLATSTFRLHRARKGDAIGAEQLTSAKTETRQGREVTATAIEDLHTTIEHIHDVEITVTVPIDLKGVDKLSLGFAPATEAAESLTAYTIVTADPVVTAVTPDDQPLSNPQGNRLGEMFIPLLRFEAKVVHKPPLQIKNRDAVIAAIGDIDTLPRYRNAHRQMQLTLPAPLTTKGGANLPGTIKNDHPPL